MMEQQKPCGGGLTHREAIGRVAVALGAMSVLNGDVSLASPAAQAAPRNPNFPQVPSWDLELREIAPNVYGYVQGGGPDRDNFQIANAGIVIGEDGVLVFDSLAAPIHANRFIGHIRKVRHRLLLRRPVLPERSPQPLD